MFSFKLNFRWHLQKVPGVNSILNLFYSCYLHWIGISRQCLQVVFRFMFILAGFKFLVWISNWYNQCELWHIDHNLNTIFMTFINVMKKNHFNLRNNSLPTHPFYFSLLLIATTICPEKERWNEKKNAK